MVEASFFVGKEVLKMKRKRKVRNKNWRNKDWGKKVVKNEKNRYDSKKKKD